MKELISVPLNEVRTSDIEGLGQEVERDGVIYRWVKNFGATAIVASGCCLLHATSVEIAAKHKVVAEYDGIAATVGSMSIPAGSPCTGIGPSGSATGDHGWIAVKGIKNTYVHMAYTMAQMVAGCVAVGTSAQPATQPWDKPNFCHPTSLAEGPLNIKGITIVNSIPTSGVITSILALCDIHCVG